MCAASHDAHPAFACRLLQPPDLVADPRGFLVVFELDGKLELLLQPFERPQRTLALDFAAPAQEERSSEQSSSFSCC